MALSYDEVMAKARTLSDGGNTPVSVGVAISTLQTGGLCMWGTGTLRYQPGGTRGLVFGFPSLRSDSYAVNCYFSDRLRRMPAPPGGIGGHGEPFDDSRTELMRVTVSTSWPRGGTQPSPRLGFRLSASLRFREGDSFSVPLAPEGDGLTGVGPALASSVQADHALYAFTFSEPYVPRPVN